MDEWTDINEEIPADGDYCAVTVEGLDGKRSVCIAVYQNGIFRPLSQAIWNCLDISEWTEVNMPNVYRTLAWKYIGKPYSENERNL